jgi:2-succinyl-6-hydroxy-2,4-cyclohexadiene-1-carboxylate synthase
MGGRIGLHFALWHPERVRSLILESTSPGIADNDERIGRLKRDEELAARLERIGMEQFVDEWLGQPLFASQRSLPPERQALGRRLRMKNSPQRLAMALRGFSVGGQEPLHSRVKELAMPTLVIAGEWDEKYGAIGGEMARSIPHARFRIIPEAGHAPHWEKPAETAAVAAEFLRDVK